MSRENFLRYFPDVSRETLEKLSIYEALLKERGQTLSLVGRSTLEDIWTRHFLDSAQVLPHLAEGAVIDMGTGAGFPGMVLALIGQKHINLVENNQKKIAFLREVAAATGAPVTIHNVKVEALAFFPAATVTARALAPLKDLLRLALPWLKTGSAGLFLKGKSAAAELEAARHQYHLNAVMLPSLTAPESHILKIVL